jgi:hypothetical protein
MEVFHQLVEIDTAWTSIAPLPLIDNISENRRAMLFRRARHILPGKFVVRIETFCFPADGLSA